MTNFKTMMIALCDNPTRYTRNGRFWEVVAFMDGYDYARSLSFAESTLEREGSRFAAWLEARTENPKNCHWAFLLLTECSHDERAALERLPQLYEAFLEAEEDPTDLDVRAGDAPAR